MRHLLLPAFLLTLTACHEGPSETSRGLCRPDGLPAAKLELGGTDFSGHVVSVDVIEEAGAPVQVYLVLDAEGAEMFAQLTADHVGEAVPIAVNGETLSSPVIREEIEGGEVTISGPSSEEARSLALQIAPPCS